MAKRLPLSVTVVALAALCFLWDHLLAGQTFYLRDVIFDALPWRRFAAHALSDGGLPLRNPHSRFGQPYLANPQSAVVDAAEPVSPPPAFLDASIGRTEFGREEVALEVTVKRPALLVVADTLLAGWTARVDGERREIVPVNLIFRGVVLRPGDREVRMTYAAPGFAAGRTVSLVSLVLCVALLAFVLSRRVASS